MIMKLVVRSAVLLSCILSLPLTSCVPKSGPDDEPEAEAASELTEASAADHVGVQLQHEISQALWGCFSVGADLTALGDVTGAKAVLRHCFSDNMDSETFLPPAYAGLAFSTSGGPDGWVDAAHQLYQSLHIQRAQHLITNIVIKKTGPNTAIVHSGALAVHVYPDEHVFNATVKFVDNFQRIHGVWKITHRAMTLTSVSQGPAWIP